MKPFQLIVAGGRDFSDTELFLQTMQLGNHESTEQVDHGSEVLT